jgi:PadR family transcriptional regulator, regulatory protein PadR
MLYRTMGSAAEYALATLREGPLPGALIIERARELSGGRVRLTVGGLHDVLDGLTEAGLVDSGADGFLEDSWLRRYHLTGAGEATLLPAARSRPFVVRGRLRLLTSWLSVDLQLTVLAAPRDEGVVDQQHI